MPNSRAAKSDTVRQDATGYNRAQRKLVRAYARGNGVPLDFPRHGDCAQAAADSMYRLELPSSSRHANRSNRTQWNVLRAFGGEFMVYCIGKVRFWAIAGTHRLGRRAPLREDVRERGSWRPWN